MAEKTAPVDSDDVRGGTNPPYRWLFNDSEGGIISGMTATTDTNEVSELEPMEFPEPFVDFRPLKGKVVAVASWKGGQGKTTLAAEIAWLLNAVLVDADWDEGNATRSMGYLHERYKTAPLMHALVTGQTPKIWSRPYRADLVPSHPDLGVNQPDRDHFALELERWAQEWNRPVVVDTHPGGCDLTYGALAAASVVLVPAIFGKKDLDALAGMCRELKALPLMIIPSMIGTVPQRWARERAEDIVRTYGMKFGSSVSLEGWIKNRQVGTAITSAWPPAARAERYAEQMREIAQEAVDYVR